jgi:hypothetical protein
MHRVYNLNTSTIQRNPSLEILESLIQLPKISPKNKKFDLQIEDDDFIIRYFENKKRINIKYQLKNTKENKSNIAGIILNE